MDESLEGEGEEVPLKRRRIKAETEGPSRGEPVLAVPEPNGGTGLVVQTMLPLIMEIASFEGGQS